MRSCVESGMKQKKNRFGIIGILLVVVLLLGGAMIVMNRRISEYDQLSVTEKTTRGDSGVEIYLPDVYYAASGLTMEIYNSQITNQGSHISEYQVVWECEVGKLLEEKYSVDASEEMIGEYPLKVSVYDQEGMLAAEREVVLCITEAKKEQFSVLAIGDSLSANGALYSRMQEHLDGALICNGTRGYEGFLTEARLGFSAADYLSETAYTLEEGEEVHRFWNQETERFDWNYYKESTGFQPDVIWLHLGTNGLLSGEENAENICQIVRMIRQDDEKIPIYVVNSIYQSDQNGIGSMTMNNGTLMFQNEYKQERDLAVFRLMEYLSEELADEKYIYLVPAAISVDSANVFQTEAQQVNPYSEITEQVATDAVHPAAKGYEQIADTIYSTMCGTMSDWQ